MRRHGTANGERGKLIVRGQALKIWNGRGGEWRGVESIYVCGHSQADAVKLITEAGHPMMSLYELRIYFAAGAWGVYMNGIERVRGVWIQGERYGKVERVI